jgi:hypothetical protein
LDEQLGGGEEEVKDEGAAGEGGVEEEGADQPEQEVDEEGEVEGLVEAGGVGGSEGFGGFLGGVSRGLNVDCGICVAALVNLSRMRLDVSRCNEAFASIFERFDISCLTFESPVNTRRGEAHPSYFEMGKYILAPS